MKALRFVGPCMAALLAAGCGKSQPSFPIGIWGVKNPDHLPALRAAGFDTFQSDAQDPNVLGALARAARAEDLSLVAYPQSLLNRPLRLVRGWPVAAWYLYDEPDVSRTPPAELDELSRRTRAWDSVRLQTLVIGEGAPAKIYGSIPDILLLDWYPVPHLALDSLADQIDIALAALAPGKPLWVVLQAFDWRDYPQRDPGKPRIGRFPDHREIRFMSYLAIIHGVRGLFYYTLAKPEGRTLLDVPEEWQALSRVVWEMQSMKSIFRSRKRLDMPPSWAAPGLEGGLWRHRGRPYVILLNRKRDVLVPIPRELLIQAWRPLFEPRRDIAELLRRVGNDSFLAPYQVLVLEGRLGMRTPR